MSIWNISLISLQNNIKNIGHLLCYILIISKFDYPNRIRDIINS